MKGTTNMKTAILGVIMKFFSVDFIGRVFAAGISALIKYASRKGGNTWVKAKSVMKKTENWIHLFNEVYEDDTMTKEEEEKIAQAISNMTAVKKISKIISDKNR